jgi:hypothetical protein
LRVSLFVFISSPVLCGCETWFLTLREKRKTEDLHVIFTVHFDSISSIITNKCIFCISVISTIFNNFNNFNILTTTKEILL